MTDASISPSGPHWALALGRRSADFVRLARFDKPIGIFLLLWPTLWALWLAAGQTPKLRMLLIFVAGTIVMRSAGCVVNDLADRNIDPHVRRTRGRPLAARRLSPYEAWVFFAVLVALALLLVTRLDRNTVLLSLVGAVLTISYPLMKRFFPLPQFYLGAAFGWAVPMAYMATMGSVPRSGWLLFLVTVLWAGVYDTVYAMADREDDEKLGLNSTAIAFGDLDRHMVAGIQIMVLGGLLMVGRAAQLNWPFYLFLGIGAVLFAVQQFQIRKRDREGCLAAFHNNNYFGLSILLGVALGQ